WGSIDGPVPYAFIERKPRGIVTLPMYGVSGSSVCPLIMSAVSAAAPVVYLVTFGHQRSVRPPLCANETASRFGVAGAVMPCALAARSATDGRNGAARLTP